MKQWRFIPPEDGRGAWNMAADVVLREAVRAGTSGPVLRFYRWAPPCVTLGRFQPALGNVNMENCARLGIEVASRPTGGRAILHDREVTFSIIIAEADLPAAGSNVMDSYRTLGSALAAGLQLLGVPAELVEHRAGVRTGDPVSVSATGNPACFAAKARCDLMVHGQKIIGSAQQRKGGVILQQNSLPISIDFAAWEQVFYRSDAERVERDGATDLQRILGYTIAEETVVQALCAGFTSTLGVEFVKEALTDDERARIEILESEYHV